MTTTQINFEMCVNILNFKFDSFNQFMQIECNKNNCESLLW